MFLLKRSFLKTSLNEELEEIYTEKPLHIKEIISGAFNVRGGMLFIHENTKEKVPLWSNIPKNTYQRLVLNVNSLLQGKIMEYK